MAQIFFCVWLAMLVPGPEPTSEIQRLGGHFLAEGSSPSWSPTGSHIVYCRGDELVVLDIQNGKTRRVVRGGRSPVWSPGNGRYIAYVSGRVGEEEIFLCEAAGGSPQRLAAGKNSHVSSPCSRSGRTAESETLAAVTTAEWMIFSLLSTPTCAFMPKYHCLPFLVWCISGSRCCSRFFVELGA